MRRVLIIIFAFALITSLNAAERHRAPVLAFMKLSGHPNGWKGHVVDHIVPLCAGGEDAPSNMQWQELAVSYRKDVFERALCAEMKRQGLVLVKKEKEK